MRNGAKPLRKSTGIMQLLFHANISTKSDTFHVTWPKFVYSFISCAFSLNQINQYYHIYLVSPDFCTGCIFRTKRCSLFYKLLLTKMFVLCKAIWLRKLLVTHAVKFFLITNNTKLAFLSFVSLILFIIVIVWWNCYVIFLLIIMY